MGQLRNGILALQKASLNLEPMITTLPDEQDKFSQDVISAGNRIEEGLNVLVMYLMEKFKKEGKSFDSEAAKTLKDVMDSNVLTFGKGIAQAKTDVKAVQQRVAAKYKTKVDGIKATLTQITTESAKLKAVAEKKKAKWLKSAKYKAKIDGYLAAINAIDDIAKRYQKKIDEHGDIYQNDTWVERCYKFSQDMPIKQVRNLASSGLNNNLKDFLANNTSSVQTARKFRDDYKGLGNQFASLKKFIDDADAMETESEEK